MIKTKGRDSRGRWWCGLLGLGLGAAIVPSGRAETGMAAPAAPKLAVVISLDQFRYDYLLRFRPYFGADGFNRFLAGGADFTDCHYRHAVTKTAPGHATILSGVHADVHGIIGNEWFEPDTFEFVNAVEDTDSPLLGAAPQAPKPGALAEKSGRSPRHFLATTVGDQLKLRFGDASRVVSISNKDRAAILMGGRLADDVYWIDHNHFVTSTYYHKALPDWVAAINQQDWIGGMFGRTWELALDRSAYEAAGPDDAEGEMNKWGLGRTFPHHVDGGADKPGPDFYDAFDCTPFYTEILAHFAREIVKVDQLGHHDAPDLLCIGFSQIDYTGHAYGPDSWEVMDSVVRMDRTLAELFAFLDKEVGRDNYVLVLTADHGAAPLPERLQAFNRGVEAARFDARKLDAIVNDALTASFGPLKEGEFWVVRDNAGYRLRPKTFAAHGVTPAAASAVIKNAVLSYPLIEAAYTQADLLALSPDDETIAGMSSRSFRPGLSPEVAFVLKPYVVDRVSPGTNHGTPWDYDTHVPMLWAGPGVPAGARSERVSVDQLAPTLAALLQVPPPAQALRPRLF